VTTWTAKFASAVHSLESAANRITRRKVKPTPLPEKNRGATFNASGVVQVGQRRFVFIDNHDPGAFFEIKLDAKDEEVEWIRRRPLAGIVDGQFSDPEGLCRVDENGEIYLIAASSLCATGADRSGRRRVSDGLVRARYTPEGDLPAEAMAGFRAWLLAHEPSLVEAGEREPDAGGLNIEGLAWDPAAGELLFGQRGPADPGRITVIAVSVDAAGAAWTTASLATPAVVHAAIPHSSATLGIRDISYDNSYDVDSGRFLIVLGRSLSRGDEPFQLCTWNRGSDTVRPLAVSFHRSMKPEGLTTFSSGDKKKILVVDDGGGYAVLRSPKIS
jgi:hypothetical protein